MFYQKKGEATTSAKFFRDGYTDIRGKIEYALSAGSRLNDVEKFAILVQSDELGSVIKECSPPKLETSEQEVVGIQNKKAERVMKNWNYQNAKKK